MDNIPIYFLFNMDNILKYVDKLLKFSLYKGVVSRLLG